MAQREIIEALLKKGALKQKDLETCQQQATQKNQSILDCLIEGNFVNPDEVARQRGLQYGLPFIEKITEKMADPTLLAKIPLKFLRQHAIMPALLDDGRLVLLTSDPAKFQPLDEVAMILGTHEIAIASYPTIVDSINRFYPLEGTKQMIEELDESKTAPGALELEELEQKDILAMASEAPIIKLVNHIFVQAVKRGASDIHIEPYEKEVRVRYRVDGVMYQVFTPPKRIQAALGSRIKIMANLNIAEKRLPQDGRIQIKVADKSIDIRVSVLPVNFGERIVMRLLDKSRTFSALQELGFSDRDYKIIVESISRPNGIIYVSGPTGSGKTSTLYSILNKLNTPDVNIITVEDPVEYQMPGIAQVQVNDKIGLTFAAALRSILRQDPDIVMIGETRDQETAQIAIQAALTGHLVLSTIHTNNAPASITRLIDMGIEPFLIASSIVAIIAQRLVRRLCNKCKQIDTSPTQDVLSLLGLSAQEAHTITFYKPIGCEECNETGYRGRLAIFEIMVMSPALAKLTMERADMGELRKQALAEGMTLLVADGIRKIKKGLTTAQEVMRVATQDEVLED